MAKRGRKRKNRGSSAKGEQDAMKAESMATEEMEKHLVSNEIKKGVPHAPHRALLYACGLSKEMMDKPFIGIASSFSDIPDATSFYQLRLIRVKNDINIEPIMDYVGG